MAAPTAVYVRDPMKGSSPLRPALSGYQSVHCERSCLFDAVKAVTSCSPVDDDCQCRADNARVIKSNSQDCMNKRCSGQLQDVLYSDIAEGCSSVRNGQEPTASGWGVVLAPTDVVMAQANPTDSNTMATASTMLTPASTTLTPSNTAPPPPPHQLPPSGIAGIALICSAVFILLIAALCCYRRAPACFFRNKKAAPSEMPAVSAMAEAPSTPISSMASPTGTWPSREPPKLVLSTDLGQSLTMDTPGDSAAVYELQGQDSWLHELPSPMTPSPSNPRWSFEMGPGLPFDEELPVYQSIPRHGEPREHTDEDVSDEKSLYPA